MCIFKDWKCSVDLVAQLAWKAMYVLGVGPFKLVNWFFQIVFFQDVRSAVGMESYVRARGWPPNFCDPKEPAFRFLSHLLTYPLTTAWAISQLKLQHQQVSFTSVVLAQLHWKMGVYSCCSNSLYWLSVAAAPCLSWCPGRVHPSTVLLEGAVGCPSSSQSHRTELGRTGFSC